MPLFASVGPRWHDRLAIVDIGPDLLALLVAAAAFAGWVDAVVGGGGLVLIPALLLAFPRVAPATAFGTNKFTAVWGTGSAVITFLRRTTVPRKFLAAAVPLALVCSGLGAAAAALSSTGWMHPMVVVLLVVVAMVARLSWDLLA